MSAGAARATAPVRRAWLGGLLRTLVRTPSVNPGDGEAAMARCIAAQLAPGGIATTAVESLPGRHSLAAVLDSGRPGPALVLNGHMDTVPVDDAGAWTTDPFGGAVAGEHLYGRGACDMKAGLAAQIGVALALAGRGGPRRGRLVLHFAIGEERAEPGTRSLCEAGFLGDVGVVTEPTGLHVAIAARGMAGMRVVLSGRSAHASRPDAGANPIEALPGVLAALERFARERGGDHPLLPGGTCTPTVVHAGSARNAIADRCELLCDVRLLPGRTIAGEAAALGAALAALTLPDGIGVSVEAEPHGFEPAEIPAGSPFAARLNAIKARVTGEATPLAGTPFASDVAALVAAGVEAVTFGPGHIEECHCADERVSLVQLEQCAQALLELSCELLGS